MQFRDIQDRIVAMESKHWSKTAIEGPDSRISYAQLRRMSNAIASSLINRGAQKGAMVAIFLERSIDLIPVVLGVLKAGCVFAPLNPADPDNRLESILLETTPDWLITEISLGNRANRINDEAESTVLCLDGDSDDLMETRQGVSDFQSVVPVEMDDACYLYFTSGSTGTPKAILGTVKGLSHFVDWEIATFDIDHDSRISQLMSPTFDPFLRDVFVPLCSGGTICIPANRNEILDIPRLVEWIDSREISLMHCVPALFRAIVNHQPDPTRFRSLEYILIAGDMLYGAEVGKWMDIYGSRIQLVNLYGPTETTLAKFCYFVSPSDKDRGIMPVGKPIDGARGIVVDEGDNICPPGTIGEILIRTPYCTAGYYNDPEMTERAFVQNPFSSDPEDIVYKTGDIGRVLDDGNFEVLGRRDYQVKIRGIRVELGEIENALLRHEMVTEVVVQDWKDRRDERILCAYIVSPDEPTDDELRAFLSDHVPPYMIPSFFVLLDKLPLTLHGKVDRRSLPNPLDIGGRNVDYVAPRNQIEEKLATIWKEILQYPGEVGIDDSFFALGGHSLNVTQVLAKMNTEFNVSVPLRDFFNAPTIREVAVLTVQIQAQQVAEQMGESKLAELLLEMEELPKDGVQ